jgi:hypothetical protein
MPSVHPHPKTLIEPCRRLTVQAIRLISLAIQGKPADFLLTPEVQLFLQATESELCQDRAINGVSGTSNRCGIYGFS